MSRPLPSARTALEVMSIAPVIPVVTVPDPDTAIPIAEALLVGGVRVIELTLRTPSALESAARIAAALPEMVLGVGTVLTPRQADDAVGAGAHFLVTPGTTPELLHHLLDLDVPFLPGVATVSEAMRAIDAGVTELKFFPARPAGGAAALAAIRAPLPGATFCPTGGISPADAPEYLALPNVACVGGSWLTPADAILSEDWARITHAAAASVGLGGRAQPTDAA